MTPPAQSELINSKVAQGVQCIASVYPGTYAQSSLLQFNNNCYTEICVCFLYEVRVVSERKSNIVTNLTKLPVPFKYCDEPIYIQTRYNFSSFISVRCNTTGTHYLQPIGHNNSTMPLTLLQ